MKLYLLTAVTDHEGEDPVFLAATLEEAKAAAVPPSSGWNGCDWFQIYEAEPGTKPVPLLENVVTSHWDHEAHRAVYTPTDWTTA